MKMITRTLIASAIDDCATTSMGMRGKSLSLLRNSKQQQQQQQPQKPQANVKNVEILGIRNGALILSDHHHHKQQQQQQEQQKIYCHHKKNRHPHQHHRRVTLRLSSPPSTGGNHCQNRSRIIGGLWPSPSSSTAAVMPFFVLFCLTALTMSNYGPLSGVSAAALADPVPGPIASPGINPGVSILHQFSPNCSVVSPIFQANGINAADIPKQPSDPEIDLRYCESPTVGTCCTYSMESKMALKSRLQLEKLSKEQILKLTSSLGTKAQKFDEDFRKLLLKSKEEFHNMFTRTYGIIYQQNSFVFSDLFNELENYYARGRVNLMDVMDKFFNVLYQKMFQVLNSQYSFDEKYLQCVSQYMKELKPFGDVPEKLSVQIKRSFVATRTYGQALTTAVDVAKKLVYIRVNADCTTALTKMQHCGVCKGYTEKPCTNYCINVIKGCLHYLQEFDIEWDNFVMAMDKLGERLLGSFNIVMVIEPINIKISEAIMNFQDSGQDIKTRVFQGCGYPSLGRSKRSITARVNPLIADDSHVIKKRLSLVRPDSAVAPASAAMEDDDEDILDIDATLDEAIVLRERRNAAEPQHSTTEHSDAAIAVGSDPSDLATDHVDGDEEETESDENLPNDESSNQKRNQQRRKQQQSSSSQQQPQQQRNRNDDMDYNGHDPNLEKMIRDIRQRVKESKKIWSNLSQQICSNEEIASASDADGMCWNGHTIDRYMHPVTTEHGSNPEFPPNPASMKQTSQVAVQLNYLKNAISHLKNAYNGQDIDWKDQEEPYFASGAGSGAGIDDEDDDDDDDEDEGGEGSGHHAFVPIHKPDHIGGGVAGRDDSVDTDGDVKLRPDGGTVITQTSRPKYPGGVDTNKLGNGRDDDDDDDDEEGGGGKDDDDGHYGGGSKANRNNGSGSATRSAEKMSLRRALLVYLLPLYMTWFGGICAEFL